jgi:hypothetical protein
MKHHVGLDVAQATAAIGLVDGEGRTLAEGVTATEPCAIAAFVRRRAPSIERIGHRADRASSGSGWRRGRCRSGSGTNAGHSNCRWSAWMPGTATPGCQGRPEGQAGEDGPQRPRGPHAASRVGWWAAGIAQLVRTGWFRQVHVEAETSHAAILGIGGVRSWRRGPCWCGCAAISRTRSVACSRRSVSLSAGAEPVGRAGTRDRRRRAGRQARVRQPRRNAARHAGGRHRADRLRNLLSGNSLVAASSIRVVPVDVWLL